MNYFELLGLPVALRVDKERVRKKYFELSRKYHPDYFAQGTSGEQEEALQASAHLNKALKIFSNPDATLQYTLKLKGVLEEEEKYTLSPAFLMDMLDINEAVLEAAGDTEAEARLHAQLNELENEIYEPVHGIIENYEEGVTTQQELLQVKDYYFKKKYIQRLYSQLGGNA